MLDSDNEIEISEPNAAEIFFRAEYYESMAAE